MSETQKIIKYLAIAFAIFLIFNIISGIMFGIVSIGNIFSDKTEKNKMTDKIDINDNTLILDVDVVSVNVIIKEGNEFKAETNNKYIDCKQKYNKLYIKERKHNWFSRKNNSDLIVYVPSNYLFDAISIKSGAGKVSIDNLSSQKLYLDLGAGKVNIDNLKVLDNTEIEGGAGEIVISNGKLHNLDLNMGVGKLSLTSEVTGNSEIDAGVGKMDLNLIGNIDQYKIKLDKGIGSATIDGDKMNDDIYYGNGVNIIDIDGGIGSIKIDFLNL